jgi:hypothetical protein
MAIAIACNAPERVALLLGPRALARAFSMIGQRW